MQRKSDIKMGIDDINHQIELLSDKRNTIIQVNRVAKTAIDVFRDILEKDKLERNDLELLIDKILVFEDHLEIKLIRHRHAAALRDPPRGNGGRRKF